MPIKIILLLTILGLSACASAPPRKAGDNTEGVTFNRLGKSDIDIVVEIHQQETFNHLRLLMSKLYARNPKEWKKSGAASAEAAVARVFETKHDWKFPELQGKSEIDSIRLAFQEDFKGDRVLALIGGVGGMLLATYNYKTEFYVFDDLDPQKLYNGARNVEIAIWKLSQARDEKGNLLLISNESAPIPNLSFERVCGKIIAQQDTVARIVADKTNRTIMRFIQGLASAVFLPI